MDLFLFVPTTALGCYLIIVMALLRVKMTKLKRIFLMALCPYLAWTLGSVCMRFNIGESYIFWYHLSLFGMFMIPSSTLIFMDAYMYGRIEKVSRTLAVVSCTVFVANVLSDGGILSLPSRVVTNTGTRFVYDGFGPQALIPYLGYVGITVYFLRVLWRGVNNEAINRRDFRIIAMGKVLLLLGNILILVPPFKGFPIDMAMGIPDAFCIMTMVSVSHKIRQNREALQHNVAVFCYGLAAVLSAIFAVPCVNVIQTYIPKDIERFTSTFLVIAVLLFYMITHQIITKVTDSFYLKEGELQLLRINAFREKSAQSLDVKVIQDLICQTAKEWVEADWTELLVWDEATDLYIMTRSFHDGGKLRIPASNSFMKVLKETKKGMDLYSVSMPELDNECAERISSLKRIGISLVQPFYDERGMYAMMVVSREKTKYLIEEKQSLEILAEISMDAVRNANLYTEVYLEARTDALTGVGNRKYLYETIDMLERQMDGEAASLMLVKVDDFRVFNQIYGVAGGDIGLIKISTLLKERIHEKGKIFRYGASEFLLILPGQTAEDARKFAEEIRLNVMKLDDIKSDKHMIMTVSIGIYETRTYSIMRDKSLDKCAMALYMAQQEGQNCSIVFGENQEQNTASINKRMYREYESIFKALTSAIDAKDHYTATHALNVSYYATELAKALNLSAEETEILKEAGLLHDIGKIGIPEAILLKPDRLSEDEYRVMKTHVNQAGNILHHLSGMEYILPAVLGHHERYDGKGYPRGLAGEEIPLAARVLNIVDSFDAMISVRPYKTQLSLEYATQQLLKGRETQFDPMLAKVFVDLIESGQIQVRRGVASEKKQSQA